MTNYNNSEHTVKALNSIYASDIGNCLVVIVDNASEKREQEKLEAVRSKYPATKIIYNDINLGYFPGLNVGLNYIVTKSFTRRGDEDFFNVSQEICQGYGAMYMLTPLFFTHFSQLTEEPFLLYEEFFLSVQLAEKGYKVFYDPRVTLVHSCKGATGLIPGKLKWSYSKVSHEKYKQYLKENECD